MIKIKARKKMRGLVEHDEYQLCGHDMETIQHLMTGCKNIAENIVYRNT